MGRYYQSLKLDPQANETSIGFVRIRTGGALISPRPQFSLDSILLWLPAIAERLLLRVVINLLPRPFREQNVILPSLGERHHCLYEFHSLRQLFSARGIEEIERSTVSTSRYSDFPPIHSTWLPMPTPAGELSPCSSRRRSPGNAQRAGHLRMGRPAKLSSSILLPRSFASILKKQSSANSSVFLSAIRAIRRTSSFGSWWTSSGLPTASTPCSWMSS